MGCWNQTCFVTRVPITAGEKIKLFILQGHGYSYSDGTTLPLYSTIGDCYNTERWYPVGGPITAKYDDYGWAEDFVEDASYKVMEAYLKEQHKMTFEEYSEKTHREPKFHTKGLVFHGGEGKDGKHVMVTVIHPYSYCMVPESIYNSIVKNFGKMVDTWSRYEDDKVEKTHRVRKEAQLRDILKRRKVESDSTKLFAEEKVRDAIRRIMDMEKVFNHAAENVLQGPLLDAATGEDEFKKMLDYMLFSHALSDLRTEWAPQCGQGSQSDEFELHMIRNKAANAYCRKQLKSYEE